MGRVNESVKFRTLAASERDAQVARLAEPWIGDEGPLEASFRRGFGTEPLRQRGLAFDDETTVFWDEDAVQVVHAQTADPGIIALRSPVLLRQRFSGPEALQRIDYLRAGALIASRYVVPSPVKGDDDA